MSTNVPFPEGVKYNSKLPQAVASGRVANRKYFATNSNSVFSYSTTNEIRIDVNADRNTFLNTAQGYLEFNLGVQNQSVILDGSAASWISQFRIQSLGADVEMISSYNLLFTILLQYTSSVSSLVSSNALMGSYRGVNMVPKFGQGTVGGVEINSNVFTMDNATAGVGLVNFESTGGRCNINPFDCESISLGTMKTFAVPLISGFLSGDTYLPVGSSKGFTIILTLAQNELLGTYGAAGGTYTISNISYNVPVITITDPSFIQAYDSMFEDQQRISFYGQTYKNSVSSLIGSGGQQTLLVNDRSKSLNGVICALRANNVAIPAFDRCSLSCRTIAQVSSFCIKIGDVQYPQSQIDITANGVSGGQIDGGRADTQYRGLGADQNNLNISRAMAEVMKVFRSLHSSLGTGCVSADNFCSDEGLDLTLAPSNLPMASTTVKADRLSHYGMGILGVDLSCYSGDENNISGIDTASNNLNLSLLFNFQTLVGASYETQTYCVVDAIYSLNYDGSFSAYY